MALLSGWCNRVKLAINKDDIDAILSGFPVRLYISDSSGRNAKDITFVFDGGRTSVCGKCPENFPGYASIVTALKLQCSDCTTG